MRELKISYSQIRLRQAVPDLHFTNPPTFGNALPNIQCHAMKLKQNRNPNRSPHIESSIEHEPLFYILPAFIVSPLLAWLLGHQHLSFLGTVRLCSNLQNREIFCQVVLPQEIHVLASVATSFPDKVLAFPTKYTPKLQKDVFEDVRTGSQNCCPLASFSRIPSVKEGGVCQ